VLAAYPDAAFVVVGKTYTETFVQRAEELGVTDNLHIVGEVPSSEIPNFVAAADIEAHDLDGGGCGTANLEVMAAGVPTIVAVRPDNFLGIELRTGENIVLVPPSDPVAVGRAIVAVLSDPAGAKRIGSGQRQLIDEHFTLDVVASRHEQLFEELVQSAPRNQS
jgi:1,2-diacylglycerol 3-alpha-glucosyltransferase